MYLLTIEALATSIKQIIEYVNSEHFKDMLADVLGKDVEVTGPTSLEFEVMGSESPKGTSPLAPSKGASPTAPLELAPLDEANVSVEEELPSYGVALICLLIFLLILIPLLVCFYARKRYGVGNEKLWVRYKLAHHNPALPPFYIPKDLHERLRMQLFDPEAFEAQLRKEMDEIALETDDPRLHWTSV